jgi:hypothetical protein
MIQEKDFEHLIFDKMVRTSLKVSSEYITDGTMESELNARALNKNRIKDMLYGKEVKELERLLTDLSFMLTVGFISEREETLERARNLCRELLK